MRLSLGRSDKETGGYPGDHEALSPLLAPAKSYSSRRSKFWLRVSLLVNILAVLFVARWYIGDSTPPSAQIGGAPARATVTVTAEPQIRYMDGPEDTKTSPPAATTTVVKTIKGCDLCTINATLCDELGAGNLARAVAFGGSNARLRRVLAKLRQGKPFTMAVTGGSVSRGHGLGGHNIEWNEKNMYRQVFNHLNDLFPGREVVIGKGSGKAEGKNALMNEAQGGVGSDYWSLCFQAHITDDVDLVITELGINDEALLKRMDSFELLMRGLLDLPGEPAVLNFQVIALAFPKISMGGDLHHGVAQYYDVPTLSMRNALLDGVLANETRVEDLFPKVGNPGDPNMWREYEVRHINRYGHQLAASIMNAYIDQQLCEMKREEAALGLDPAKIDIDKQYPLPPVPRQRLLQKFDAGIVVPPLRPNCFSMNGRKNPLVPAKSDGWREWNWKDKNYLIADKPGSTISFAFHTVLGSVQLFYLRSGKFGLGNLECWVDNDTNRKKVLEGYWNLKYNIGQAVEVRGDLKEGDHMLHCKLLDKTSDPNGGKEFRIISLMSI